MVTHRPSPSQRVRSIKVKLELAVDDDQVDRVVEAIIETARTGKIGDGKIFIFDLGQAVRIRTGEAGSRAL